MKAGGDDGLRCFIFNVANHGGEQVTHFDDTHIIFLPDRERVGAGLAGGIAGPHLQLDGRLGLVLDDLPDAGEGGHGVEEPPHRGGQRGIDPFFYLGLDNINFFGIDLSYRTMF